MVSKETLTAEQLAAWEELHRTTGEAHQSAWAAWQAVRPAVSLTPEFH